jgi:hypothetical protein
MEYVEGENLNIRMGRKPLSLKEIFQIKDEIVTKTITEETLTQEGSIIGTLAYMSPEQARGDSVDSRSDIFSLGIILYDLLTGKNPFSRRNTVETVSVILKDQPSPINIKPRKLNPILDRILSRGSLSSGGSGRYKRDSRSGRISGWRINRMKKISIVCLCLSLLAPSIAAEFRWADVYEAGPVKLIPDPSFGKGVDWGSFLFESFKDLAVAEDGTIFVANSRENTIHKFDPSGKKVLTFGQKGQGPGDLESPNCPSVLDGKYLVVGEYATNRRISLFGLDGRFHKLLKAKRPVYDVAALGGTKIAYVSRQFEQGDAGQKTAGVKLTPMTIRVVLKDTETDAEQVILTRTVQQKFIQINRGPTISFGDN